MSLILLSYPWDLLMECEWHKISSERYNKILVFAQMGGSFVHPSSPQLIWDSLHGSLQTPLHLRCKCLPCRTRGLVSVKVSRNFAYTYMHTCMYVAMHASTEYVLYRYVYTHRERERESEIFVSQERILMWAWRTFYWQEGPWLQEEDPNFMLWSSFWESWHLIPHLQLPPRPHSPQLMRGLFSQTLHLCQEQTASCFMVTLPLKYFWA